MATIRSLFHTPLYEGELGDDALLGRLTHMARDLAREDRAGRAWSREHGYRGYTSYASLNDLPQRDPDAADLKRRLDRHVAAFAGQLAFDLPKKLRLDSLWVNILKPGGAHSGHIHPHSVVSGTIYLDVPAGAGGIRFEDPRLPMMMAAPNPRGDAPEDRRRFVTLAPSPGLILLWESWLRHEVEANGAKAERISISFNYS
jgi:uncharacterized protein (TIGR02466 family)